ncbi:MAG TPA: 4-hydroxyphenylpyruvate dioxygenase [Phycisphaerae bacterium]|nr:4-hydroxyphenylpyruvate dioxygenase [Phycisphaerae bacterium]
MSQTDFLPIRGYDHLEFYVGNARQAAQYYSRVLGFRPVARLGLETGCRDRASYLMQQGLVRFVLTSALAADHEITRHCALHGDGVKVIALEVGDVEAAMREVKARGATILQPAQPFEDRHGVLKTGVIKYAGDTAFKFVERGGYRGVFAPGFEPIEGPAPEGVGLAAIDHVVTNVYLGEMNYWVRWFEQVLGFTQLAHFTDKDISTEYSALMSKVMENGGGKVKFPINEPAEGRKKSQIEEYLDFYQGPGVQHIAMNSKDICATVRALRERGIDFLRVPDTYYEDLKERVGKIDEDFSELRELGILADRDEDGYLLQIFTAPVEDRPTLFYEVIERHGSRGFGVGNFRALFISLEREQARRGNL